MPAIHFVASETGFGPSVAGTAAALSFLRLRVMETVEYRLRNIALAKSSVVRRPIYRIFISALRVDSTDRVNSTHIVTAFTFTWALLATRLTLGIYGHVVGDAQRRAGESHAERIEAGGL